MNKDRLNGSASSYFMEVEKLLERVEEEGKRRLSWGREMDDGMIYGGIVRKGNNEEDDTIGLDGNDGDGNNGDDGDGSNGDGKYGNDHIKDNQNETCHDTNTRLPVDSIQDRIQPNTDQNTVTGEKQNKENCVQFMEEKGYKWIERERDKVIGKQLESRKRHREDLPRNKRKKFVFSGYRFGIVVSASLSVHRSDIVKRRLIQQQAKVLVLKKNEREGFDIDSVDFIISEGKESFLKKIFGNQSFGGKVRSIQWVVDCIEEQTLIPYKNMFRHESDKPKSKKEENTTIQVDQDVVETPIHQETILKPTNELKLDKSQFACERALETNGCVNQVLIDELNKLQKKYDQLGDQWRSYTLRKAVNTIRRCNEKITSKDKAASLPGIGPHTAEKIGEILQNGQITRMVALENDSRLQVITKFTNIWGVGLSTATHFYNIGYRTLDDLQNADLSKQQLIGLKLYEDLQKRIPRNEVTEISEIVRKEALSICPNLEIICCGSYRRGASSSGDVDMLITDPSRLTVDPTLLENLVESLRTKKFITDDLSASFHHEKNSQRVTDPEADVYMGICYHRSIHRRLDIKIWQHQCFPFALLYFTGSDVFNRSMRLYASRKGYSLSDKSLRKAIRLKREKVAEGPAIECHSEEDIFKFLGLEYVPPEKRGV